MPEKTSDPPSNELFKAAYRDVKEGYVDRIMEHQHTELEFDLFTRANTTLTLNGRLYKITDGTLLLVASRDMHRFVHDPQSAYNRYVVMFSESFIRPALSCMGWAGLLDELKEGPRVLTLSNSLQGHMQPDFALLAAFSRQWEKNRDIRLRSTLIITLIHLLMEMGIEQKRQGPAEETLSRRKQQVQQIMTYIDRHYTDVLTLETISDVSFLSKYYVTRIFKHVTGYSVLEYIHHRRVAQAQKMLVETDLEIVDVALRCGFNNLSSFYHIFKKAAGMTPLYYRRHCGKHPALQ